ncbi:arsenate reductase/protein-tyrosine-phosphatase family protein [Leifsonia sp. AG29]|uniref:arsenate reductase/protein-tyrosine-phosphatase family protein n=1 Tax=Leifsonia sp. AG29 TaxID=2598860 RepID=UPI00131BD490|nr:low molecular weight phosphatase family protein [Leifsonia sp. AG29]
MTVRILVVCTGNLCRSPLAAELLRVALAGLPVGIRSAGTSARDGEPMPPETLAWATALGAQAAATHRSRRFQPADAIDADLVLTAGLDHRRHVAEAAPQAVRRTFTLLEFARLAETMEAVPRPLPDALAALAARRPVVQLDPDSLDVVDPHGRDEEFQRQAATAIDGACDRIGAFLRGTLAGGTP